MSTLAANVVNAQTGPPKKFRDFPTFTELQYVSIVTVGVMRAPCTRETVHSECYPIFVSLTEKFYFESRRARAPGQGSPRHLCGHAGYDGSL